MKIDEFHDNIRTLANIGQSQYMPPETIDLQINNGLKDLFREQYKHFEATQEISDTLGFYKNKSGSINVSAGTGQATLPSDFYHLTGIDVIMDDDSVVECEVLTDSHWPKRKYSEAYAPSPRFPIARQIGASKIEVLPLPVAAVGETPAIVGAKSVVIYYLRRPADAIYGYIVNPAGTGWIFQQGSSEEVDWPEIDHTRVQDKAVVNVGVILRDRVLIGNESVKKTLNQDK